tara:strand:- start:6171 stop:7523 length:1353 start_codon:yes stop_codon:yes gene_type:complete
MNDNLINNLEYTVSELSTSIKRIIEDNFDYIKLKAEVGRVSQPKSGHIYLDLKDDTSVISGIIWKGNVNKLKILPEEGLEVVCTGKVTTYAGQSKYQIIIENIEPYGIGALMALLEKRKEKLLKENLFDDNFKKEIPFLPKRIGVITSPTGAVIRDILHRIEDRFPVNVTIWPVKVQGDSSPEEIIDAIEGFQLLDQSNLEKPDVIIIARGGGSVEDLWGFNDENLVRKVFDSKIPIISAIGHETDNTLIDLVADLRAPTPTAAAEMAVPVRKNLLISVKDSYERIRNYINNRIEYEKRSLLLLDKTIPKIEVLLKNYNLRYKKASSILNISLVSMIKHYQDVFLRKTISFKANMLTKNLNLTKDNFLDISKSLINSTVSIIDKKVNSLQLQSGLLDVLSHESVLKRGFAIVKNKKSKIIKSSKKLNKDEELIINFYRNDKLNVILKRDE